MLLEAMSKVKVLVDAVSGRGSFLTHALTMSS